MEFMSHSDRLAFCMGLHDGFNSFTMTCIDNKVKYLKGINRTDDKVGMSTVKQMIELLFKILSIIFNCNAYCFASFRFLNLLNKETVIISSNSLGDGNIDRAIDNFAVKLER